MAKSSLKKWIEAGALITEMSRKQAEGLVKGLVKAGEVRSKDAEHVVAMLVDRGRDSTERFAAVVQTEVSRQVAALAARFDEIEARIEALAAGVMGRGSGAKPAASAPAATPKAAAKSATKASAKKKAPTKKAPSKKAPSQKAPATKAATRKKAPAKAAAGKKAAAKRASKPAAKQAVVSSDAGNDSAPNR